MQCNNVRIKIPGYNISSVRDFWKRVQRDPLRRSGALWPHNLRSSTDEMFYPSIFILTILTKNVTVQRVWYTNETSRYTENKNKIRNIGVLRHSGGTLHSKNSPVSYFPPVPGIIDSCLHFNFLCLVIYIHCRVGKQQYNLFT